ncbi:MULTISPECIES: ABC transporter substrate-binding protein [unclassified Streptomyces]|uniref:ABC transporter substrate-binding protein n=1 Tax=unclassified Streptomyces TaxID=2593676 RepID=UPI00037894BE|nr:MULTISPECIES: ABC transporter substrate-binding protein [unclassified Streptomyces]MYX36681.1 peptide-binding protein [Streptomyces sp. SID8377]
MNRKLLVLPALLGLAAPVLAGCGDSTGGGGGGDAIVIGSTDPLEMSADQPSPLDPATAYDGGTYSFLNNTFQMLLGYTRSSSTPEPDAAKSCTFSDTKSETYRCTLRDGLKFANGHALTSEDVKFSVDRVLKINSDIGPASLLVNIDSVEAPDPKTVVFHLKSSDATFPYKLATPAAAIVDSEVYSATEPLKGLKMEGSGPYKLDSWKDGKAVLSANPNYTGLIGKRNNEKVEVHFFSSATEMMKALAAGDVDLVNRTLESDQINEIAQDTVENVKLTETPGLAARYMFFNVEDPSVKDEAVREAIARLLDRDSLTRDVTGRTATPLFGAVPTGITGHTNSYFNAYGEPDRDKAAQVLSAAGISTPVKFTWTYPTEHPSTPDKEEAENLKKQLESTGLFDVSLQPITWKKFLKGAATGQFAAYSLSWLPDFPDAETYIAPFFADDGFLDLNYKSETIKNQLLPATRRSADRGKTDKDFAKMQEVLAQDLPMIPLYQDKQFVASREGITGAEWFLNSSSSAQFWEIGRGVTG